MSSLNKSPTAPAGSGQGKKKRAIRPPSSDRTPPARKASGTTAEGKAAANAPKAPRRPRMPDQGVIDRMVAEAAYYLAEKRNFAAGYEEEDWLAAREQIAAQLRGARRPPARHGR